MDLVARQANGQGRNLQRKEKVNERVVAADRFSAEMVQTGELERLRKRRSETLQARSAARCPILSV